jgi:hypothetical protein
MIAKEGTVCLILSIFVAMGIMLMVGCAAKVAPVENISSAEMAIKEAESSNAGVNAPLELKLATEKLSQAKAAMQKEEFEEARRLADESLLDAKLAEAKSRSEKAKKATQELRDSIQTLRQEIERSEQRNK